MEMNSLLCLWPRAAALIVLLMATPERQCFAQRWQYLGEKANSLDKVYIDTESVEQEDGFRIVLVKTVYPEPTRNKNNITLDSHIQQTALDCQKQMVYGIRTFGYFGGKQVGAAPVTTDWKTKLIPVSNDPLSQRVLSTACTLPMTSGRETTAPLANAQVPAITARSPEPWLEGENLLFAQPMNFKNAHHDDRIGSLTEFVPNGESVEDWTEMITVQVFHGLKVDPAPFLQAMGKGFAKSCPGFNSPKGIVTGQENGYVVSMLVVKCPVNPATGKPETTLFRIIKGKDALYSVQHAWRSVASDKDLSDAVLALRKVTVCDTRDPSHPCPSLDSVAPGAQSKPQS
jgi:hypothetical protein